MLFKILIILALIAIIGSLGSALYYLIVPQARPAQLAKALTIRITLSLLLFLLLLIAFSQGWITPHGV
jgi:hypothetical protein